MRSNGREGSAGLNQKKKKDDNNRTLAFAPSESSAVPGVPACLQTLTCSRKVCPFSAFLFHPNVLGIWFPSPSTTFLVTKIAPEVFRRVVPGSLNAPQCLRSQGLLLSEAPQPSRPSCLVRVSCQRVFPLTAAPRSKYSLPASLLGFPPLQRL
jgi:hypothetical protein